MRAFLERLTRLSAAVQKSVLARGLRGLAEELAEMPNDPTDVAVRNRREFDAIRSFYPLYRTPGDCRRH